VFEEGAGTGEAEGSGATGDWNGVLVICSIFADRKHKTAIVDIMIYYASKRPPLECYMSRERHNTKFIRFQIAKKPRGHLLTAFPSMENLAIALPSALR